MNPWKDLPATAPYVHPKDEPYLERLFGRVRASKRPRTNLPPHPFVGDPAQATLFLLTQHPLYKEGEEQSNDFDVDGFAEAHRRSLTFENPEYPFIYLDPKYEGTSGAAFWRPKLEPLIEATSLEDVAKKVMLISYFPYYMEEYHNPREALPTQKYAFQIVRQARDTGKCLVIISGFNEWTKEIRLDGYIRLTSRNNTLSEANLTEEKFAEIVAAIKSE